MARRCLLSTLESSTVLLDLSIFQPFGKAKHLFSQRSFEMKMRKKESMRKTCGFVMDKNKYRILHWQGIVVSILNRIVSQHIHICK